LADAAPDARARKIADQALGRRGEAVAEATALGRGWQPWRRNVRVDGAEVDLAMLRKTGEQTELLVAEVKTSRAPIADLVGRWPMRRQRRLWRAAELLCEACGADRVEVALITVVLQGDRQVVTWWVAQAPLDCSRSGSAPC